MKACPLTGQRVHAEKALSAGSDQLERSASFQARSPCGDLRFRTGARTFVTHGDPPTLSG